jgi:hypothetical protein
LIERFFSKIKQCRRVATRYDKLAANYLALIKLESIRIWLRANESASQLNLFRRPHPGERLRLPSPNRDRRFDDLREYLGVNASLAL